MLDSFLVQDPIKDKLRFEIQLARKLNFPLNHVLICGGEGEGKETLARCLASEMQTNLKTTDASSIERPGDFAALVTNLPAGEIMIIRDIERLNQSVTPIMVRAMQEFMVELIAGSGPSQRTIKLKLPRFTVFGTATHLANVRSNLKAPFRIAMDLAPYDTLSLATLVQRISLERGLNLEPSGALVIAEKANGSLKSATRMLDLVKDFAIVNNFASITDLVVFESLGIYRVGDAPIKDLTGRSFELKCMTVLQQRGLVVELTGRSSDGGIDLIAKSDALLAGGTYIVQCKDWSNPVGAHIVRDLFGVVHSQDADRGILITSGTFTPEARRFASGKRLELIDGERLNLIVSQLER